jgi:hypothetical protein
MDEGLGHWLDALLFVALQDHLTMGRWQKGLKTGRKKSIDHSSAWGQTSITHWLVLNPQVHASTQVKMLAGATVPRWSLATMAKAEAALGPVVGRGWVHWGRPHVITGVVAGGLCMGWV